MSEGRRRENMEEEKTVRGAYRKVPQNRYRKGETKIEKEIIELVYSYRCISLF